MKCLAPSLDMLDNLLNNMRLADLNAYPENPQVGTFAFVQRRVTVCVDVGADPQSPLPMWLPLTQELTMHHHVQVEPATVWVIEHELGYPNPLVQVYASGGSIVLPEDIRLGQVAGTIEIVFNSALTGTAVLVAGTERGAPAEIPSLVQEFTAATQWHITHNLGRIPGTRIWVNGREVQPESVEATSSEVTVKFGTNAVAGKLVLY